MIGTDSISPFWAGESLKVSLMNGAIAPLSTQMQHEKLKYRNAANNVGPWPERRNVLKFVMAFEAKCVAAARVGRSSVEWMEGRPTASAVGDSCDGRRGPSDAGLRAEPQTKAVRRYTVAPRISQDVCQCGAR
jgi:hypothetical protein